MRADETDSGDAEELGGGTIGSDSACAGSYSRLFDSSFYPFVQDHPVEDVHRRPNELVAKMTQSEMKVCAQHSSSKQEY